MTPLVIVDSHAHVFTHDMPHIPNPRHRITYDFTTAHYLATLDAHGVAFGVIAAASPYGDYNEYTLDATRRHRRLLGTVILEPTVERVVLDRMAADDIVGVRLPFISLDRLPDLGSFEWQRTLRRLRDLDWHVHLHLDGPRIPRVLPALEASGVKIVIDHFGRPDPALGVSCAGFQAVLRSVEKGRTWVKVSAAYRIGKALGATLGRELLRTVGPDKLMWASDCPFVGHERDVTYRETIDDVMAWVDDAEHRRKIFGANALAFYFGG